MNLTLFVFFHWGFVLLSLPRASVISWPVWMGDNPPHHQEKWVCPLLHPLDGCKYFFLDCFFADPRLCKRVSKEICSLGFCFHLFLCVVWFSARACLRQCLCCHLQSGNRVFLSHHHAFQFQGGVQCLVDGHLQGHMLLSFKPTLKAKI